MHTQGACELLKYRMYNNARAGINFNDGFGGGDLVSENLIFNTCRESGAHQYHARSSIPKAPTDKISYDGSLVQFSLINFKNSSPN